MIILSLALGLAFLIVFAVILNNLNAINSIVKAYIDYQEWKLEFDKKKAIK
ncbi:MAG: hypothetical protein IJ728_02180 [Selenomonadaceae bacterium]|nr:hypothetical protein [Selenomonadaceae bacterium]